MSSTDIVRPEMAHSVNGVSGRLFTLRKPPAPWVLGVFANQTWRSESRPVKGWGAGAVMGVDMRFDDNCKNGRNSFAITADIRVPGRRDVEACGCLHDEIREYFPELAPLIRWHLTYSDGPMHYLDNTVFLAGNRDCRGFAQGEPDRYEQGFKFGDSPIVSRVKLQFFKFIEARRAQNSGEFSVVSIAHERDPKTFSPNFTLAGYADKWHECPFSDKTAADEFCEALNRCKVTPVKIPTNFSQGKTREFDKARSAAVWHDATDEQLSMPPDELRAVLLERLPALIAEFRADMESAGFLWSCE